MTKTRTVLIALIALVPALAIASYQTDAGIVDGYPDTAHLDSGTKVAIHRLTQEGIVQGNPDGTFRPDDEVTRAEFVKIITGLLHEDVLEEDACFPDVPRGLWYSRDVCHLKMLGTIHGNALPGLMPDAYPFQPSRSVRYAEAVKVLIGLFAFSHQPSKEWYEGYIEAARVRSLGLELKPENMPTRGELAVLIHQFIEKNEAFVRQIKFEETAWRRPSKKSSSSSSMNSSVSSSSASGTVMQSSSSFSSFGNTSSSSSLSSFGNTSSASSQSVSSMSSASRSSVPPVWY